MSAAPTTMTTDDCVALAKQIYTYKTVFSPSWDLQQQARDSLAAAQQFSLALQAAQAPASVQTDPTQTVSPPSDQSAAAPDVAPTPPPIPGNGGQTQTQTQPDPNAPQPAAAS